MRYFLVFLLIGAFSQAQRYDTAVSYLQFVDSHHADVVEQTWNYMYTYTQENDYHKRNGQRKKLENILNRSLRYITKQKAYDADFQNASIVYLKGNLALVKSNFNKLLKTDVNDSPVVDKNTILRRIRKAMYQLRLDYDSAVKIYGEKYDLNIDSNNSALAQQMSHTIKVYDYYNELNILVQELKDAEAYVWQDITRLTPAQFDTRLKSLEDVRIENAAIALKLNLPNNNMELQKAFIDFQDYFDTDFINNSEPIKEILKAYTDNNRTDIVLKTEAFNKTKSWYNINRREAYSRWFDGVQNYLRSEIKPV